jgi:hypothetical protein
MPVVGSSLELVGSSTTTQIREKFQSFKVYQDGCHTTHTVVAKGGKKKQETNAGIQFASATIDHTQKSSSSQRKICIRSGTVCRTSML